MRENQRFAANCSLLFREHELLARPAAARAAGFDAVEFWWPFSEPVPADDEIEAFVSAIEDSGVHLVGLNFYAGDLAGPDCGVLSLPDRAHQFIDSLDVAIAIGERLQVEVFNALYGNRDESSTPVEQGTVGADSLVIAASAADGIGATVLVEAVSGPKPYLLRSAAEAVAVVDRVRARGASNIGFLCDTYHLTANGEDPVDIILRYPESIAHVQIADHPGRGEPGTGTSDLDGCLDALERIGYAGWIGLEYVPSTTTAESLDRLPAGARRAPATRRPTSRRAS